MDKERIQELMGKSADVFLILVACCMLAIAMALIVRAVYNMGWAAFVLWGVVYPSSEQQSASSAALDSFLRGLELLFMAPLGYLVVVSGRKYIVEQGEAGGRHGGREHFVEVKGLVVSLMIAAVGTDLIGKILGREGLSVQAASAECSVIAVLGGYYCILEWTASRRRNAGQKRASDRLSTIDE